MKAKLSENDFNSVARVYDTLATLVYGGALYRAQIAFLSSIKPNAKVLFVGGGSGKVLSYLDSLGIPLEIYYVDAAKNMVALAKKRAPFKNIKVTFKVGLHSDVNTGEKFDVILTFFFLDLFTDITLPLVIKELDAHLKDDGLWLVTDFYPTTLFWHRCLTGCMYLFFKIFSKLQSTKLLDLDLFLNQAHFSLLHERRYYYNLIQSKVFSKRTFFQKK